MTFVFGDHELDPRTFELRSHGAVIPIEPQVFDVLAYLVANRDRVVTKEELLDAVWDGRAVSESALTTRLKEARRAIGDDGTRQELIRTVHGRGYRFVGKVDGPSAVPEAPPTSVAAPARAPGPQPEDQVIDYCAADDGTLLAYATLGSPGAPPVIQLLGRLTHLEQDWDAPVWRQWIEVMAEGRRIVRFDERGGGVSQWDVEDMGVERTARDIGHVADAAGLDRFSLFGLSYAAAGACVYAAQHPERVERLVVCCCPVVGALAAHPGDDAMHQEIDITAESIGLGWGAGSARRRRMLAMQLMPDADAGTWEGFGPSPQPTVSSENLARWLGLWTSVDLSPVLPELRVPTLVIQSRNDPIVPYHQGRLFGSLVPDCRFVELDSVNHLPIAGEPAWPLLVDELEAFLPR